MSFNKGDIITNMCGCIGLYNHERESVYVKIFLKKCYSDKSNPRLLKRGSYFSAPRLATEEEKSEFKKALIKEGLYYSESNKTIIVNNEF